MRVMWKFSFKRGHLAKGKKKIFRFWNFGKYLTIPLLNLKICLNSIVLKIISSREFAIHSYVSDQVERNIRLIQPHDK